MEKSKYYSAIFNIDPGLKGYLVKSKENLMDDVIYDNYIKVMKLVISFIKKLLVNSNINVIKDNYRLGN